MSEEYITSDNYEIALLNSRGVEQRNSQWNGAIVVYTFEKTKAEEVLSLYRAGTLEINAKRYIEELKQTRRLMNDMRRYNPKI